MKIISLQPVGGIALNSYSRIRVGWRLYDESGPKIVEIFFSKLQRRFDHKSFDAYIVYTEDGHFRALPADRYISEWAKE